MNNSNDSEKYTAKDLLEKMNALSEKVQLIKTVNLNYNDAAEYYDVLNSEEWSEMTECIDNMCDEFRNTGIFNKIKLLIKDCNGVDDFFIHDFSEAEECLEKYCPSNTVSSNTVVIIETDEEHLLDDVEF